MFNIFRRIRELEATVERLENDRLSLLKIKRYKALKKDLKAKGYTIKKNGVKMFGLVAIMSYIVYHKDTEQEFVFTNLNECENFVNKIV